MLAPLSRGVPNARPASSDHRALRVSAVDRSRQAFQPSRVQQVRRTVRLCTGQVAVHVIADKETDILALKVGLEEALRAQADPTLPVSVIVAQPLPAGLVLNVEVDRRFELAKVAEAVSGSSPGRAATLLRPARHHRMGSRRGHRGARLPPPDPQGRGRLAPAGHYTQRITSRRRALRGCREARAGRRVNVLHRTLAPKERTRRGLTLGSERGGAIAITCFTCYT
jgi:hypothetical protein